MKYSFTTLGCHEWSLQEIIDNAVSMGYQGVEFRGVQGEMDLSRLSEFSGTGLSVTKRRFADAGLSIPCLDTSVAFHDADKRAAFMQEGRMAVDIAQALGCPYLRVFGDKYLEGRSRAETNRIVAEGLDELGAYAQTAGVTALLETHGDFSGTAPITEALALVSSQAVGVLWDTHHPYKAGGEPMAATWEGLRRYIKHTHVKDSKGPGMHAPLCLPGEGDVPLKELLRVLKAGGYQGFVSLEWERKWHPELPAAAVAYPAYIALMKKLEAEL